MKKLFLFLLILISINNYAQPGECANDGNPSDNGLPYSSTIPPIKIRSTNSFTNQDSYLNINKILGIPTSDCDGLNADYEPYKLMYNRAKGKLRIYNGSYWLDASPQTNIAHTADLVNNGADGTNPFITLLDIQLLIPTIATAPISATDSGTTGEIRITSTYVYYCIDTNVWVRSALTTW